MPRMNYYLNDKKRAITFNVGSESMAGAAPAGPAMAPMGFGASPSESSEVYSKIKSILNEKKQVKRMEFRFHKNSEELLYSKVGDTIVVPTESVALGGVKAHERRLIMKKFGLDEVQEGLNGNWLLRAPEGGQAGVKIAFDAARFAFERGNVASASPNMLSLVPNLQETSSSPHRRSWGLDNPGKPGKIGADVHALAAWTITRGDEEIKVAVLDEGVDSLHPWLRDAIVDELDIVDMNPHARPDGNDAHGTACAGIIGSRHDVTTGIAPLTSLVGIRIAKRDTSGAWTVFDNMDTADAIYWAVDDAKADVLSNSWFCLPSDIVTDAIKHALTNGRSKKGCVVCFAAGNSQSSIAYPGNLEGVITVGASNQWDERKVRSSQDGEDLWGSNSGKELDLLAPGVAISTTDIHGGKGMSSTLRTDKFSGTSAATPLVAGAAALILAIKPKLKSHEVKQIITSTADSLSSSGEKSTTLGHGRLNVYKALREARRK